MIKYLFELTERLKSLIAGIAKNTPLWVNQPETPEKIQLQIDRLTAMEKALEDLRKEVHAKQLEARSLSDEIEVYANSIESIAYGLEKGDAAKLTVYGIKTRRAAVPKAVPYVPLHPVIENDSDEIGYVLSSNTDPDAANYEWEKGNGADPTKTDIIPEMKWIKTTSKSYWIDDDVSKGVRYFYRVRAINNSGKGPWSEAVSRVQ
jgi:hypothetical protein